MPQWELIDHNPMLGVRKYIAADEHEEDAVLVKTEFDRDHCLSLIDQNKAMANDASGPMGDMALAARIPISVMFEWRDKFGVSAWNPAHRDGVKRLLNSPDYRYLKVRNIII
jgi:hypothetical protein